MSRLVITDQFRGPKYGVNLGHLNERELEVIKVLLEAFEKYAASDFKYQGLWQRGGTEDSFMHMTSKFERVSQDGILTAEERQAMDHDDHLDLICYTAFYIINQRAGRFYRPRRSGVIGIAQEDIKAGDALVIGDDGKITRARG